MKLREFDAVINENCNIDDWTIITTEGKKVCNNLDKYLDDEVVDIFWEFKLKTEDSAYEVKVVSMPTLIITIVHHDTDKIDYEHRFYACFEHYDGKVTKIPFATREAAMEAINKDGSNYKSIWTE